MADNYAFTAGSGSTGAADDIGGVYYPRVKITLGADGAADNDVDAGQQLMAASVPVVLASDHSDVKITLDGETVAIASIAAGDNNIGNVDIASIAAGDNNIGNVDIASAIPAGTNNIGDVDVLTVPADPFGANADAAVAAGAEGSIQAKLRLLTSQLDAVKTAVETLDNTVGGTELQVDVVGALPAGTNAIGKLAANSGVDIGDVDVTSLPALIAGTAAIGKLLPPDVDVTAHTNYAKKYYTNAGAVTDGIIWSPAAGKRWHVLTLYIQVSAAATVTLEDDLAAGDSAVWKAELAANSGVVLTFSEKYPFASGEDAADLLITTTAGNVYVTAVGYEV